MLGPTRLKWVGCCARTNKRDRVHHFISDIPLVLRQLLELAVEVLATVLPSRTDWLKIMDIRNGFSLLVILLLSFRCLTLFAAEKMDSYFPLINNVVGQGEVKLVTPFGRTSLPVPPNWGHDNRPGRFSGKDLSE